MFRSVLPMCAALTLGLTACAIDEAAEDEDVDTVDQALTAPPFRLASAAFSNTVMIPTASSAGSLVVLRSKTFSTREVWINVNQQIIHRDTNLCLQANGSGPGASMIIAACGPQAWRLHKRLNGNVEYENLPSNLYLDAEGADKALVMRPFSGLGDQAFIRQF